jgi:hypothetical protein
LCAMPFQMLHPSGRSQVVGSHCGRNGPAAHSREGRGPLTMTVLTCADHALYAEEAKVKE